jgi:MFS transporter, ACS family, allantoate permease
MYFVGLCLFTLMYLVNKYENKKRDEAWEAAGRPEQPAGQEFMDLTDKENTYFRYAL